MAIIRREYSDRVEYTNKKGQYHRTDVPAVEYSDGDKFWYLNGKKNIHLKNGTDLENANTH